MDAKSGEILGRVSRTGDEEVSRLSFSHNDPVQLRSSLPQDDEKYRIELWVGEEGSEFKAVIVDMFNVVGSYDGARTSYDISSYGTFIEDAPVFCLNDAGEVVEGVIEISGGGAYLCVFDEDTTGNEPYFMYFTEGSKGFLSVPVVGDVAVVQQEEGEREVTVRYFTEGDDV